MNKIIYSLLGILGAYLAQSFYFTSFNIAEWSAEGRAFCILMALTAVASAILLDPDNFKKKV